MDSLYDFALIESAMLSYFRSALRQEEYAFPVSSLLCSSPHPDFFGHGSVIHLLTWLGSN
jgi:hypothetical protein